MSPVIKNITGRTIKHKISGMEENSTKELFSAFPMWQHKFLRVPLSPVYFIFSKDPCFSAGFIQKEENPV